MTSLRQTLSILFFALIFIPSAFGQVSEIILQALSSQGEVELDFKTGVMCGTNGQMVIYAGTVLTAERVCLNPQTGECTADGRVRIQREDQVWVGEHVTYNFKTRQMSSEEFRTGRFPVFAEGHALQGDASNRVYTATGAYVTSDDVSEPGQRIRASSITIVPGEYIKARNAVVYLGKVPVFYYPYYVRRLDQRSNRFSVTPGYRSHYGGFLLGTYTFYVTEQFDGALRLDYRTERGVGTGADVNLHLKQAGEAEFKYYYANDEKPGDDAADNSISSDRQRFYFGYASSPLTNLYVKSRVSYESDPEFLKDFFESEYRANPDASTYLDVNKLWPNVSLDVYAQPRVNDFNETIERLPEIKLTAFRQQIGPTPFFYESESSAGWYRREYSDTNAVSIPDYDAYRADTFHQITMPMTFFNWLNVVPRVGGRFTYYGDSNATNTTSDDICREVYNTGVEVSFKASRVWLGARNQLLDVDGIRHIVTPSVDYALVSNPNKSPSDVPQFDYQLPSIRLLPIDFPDYNSIDSIDHQNAVRLRLLNKLQTKRDGRTDTLLWWDVYTDWRAQRYDGEDAFSDLYSDLEFKPRTWLALESLTQWNMDNGDIDFSLHNLTLKPNNVWSWGVGHWYTRNGYLEEEGTSAINSTIFWRLNENWASRAGFYFDAKESVLRQQSYTIYRDLRSWTAAVTFRVRENQGSDTDYAIAFTFSIKAAPRFALGSDTVNVDPLLGN